jgi:hypothetical protein
MTFVRGNQGAVRLRRSNKRRYGLLTASVLPEDVALSLNRFSFDDANDDLLTGDHVDISTSDPRGLVFIGSASANSNDGFTTFDVGPPEVITGAPTFSAFVNVNAIGGIRLFSTFKDAINNDRTKEITLAAFTGEPLPVQLELRDIVYNVLGSVTSYNFNTDREALDVSSLSDYFRNQISAGLISGGGSINCLFTSRTTGIIEPSLLMLQLMQRINVGSEFDINLYLSNQEVNPLLDTVFYDTTALITRCGVDVVADRLIECEIDFVTTGDIRLLLGRPADFLLKEDYGAIGLEQSLDYLLTEVSD